MKEQDDTLTRMLRERDQFRDDTQELYEAKKKVDRQLNVLQVTSKEKNIYLE